MGEGYESGTGINTQENESGHGSELVRGLSGVGSGDELGAINGKTYF